MTSTASGSEAERPGVLPSGPGVVWFAASGFVNALGTGFFYPFSLLFFTSLSGVSLGTVGVILTVTTLLALPGLFLVGPLTDRFGPRTVLLAAAVVRAASFVAFVTAAGVWPLVLGGVALALGNRAEQAAAPLLAVRLAPEGDSGRWLALSRVTFNAGMGGGALLAGLFVVDTDAGFVALGLANAASFVVTAVLYLGLPTPPPTATDGGPAPSPAGRVRWWRHRPFVRVAGANALLWTAALAVESALPVFVLHRLDLPSWAVGTLFAVNTGLLTALHLPVSRGLERFRPGRVLALGGLCYVTLYASAVLAEAVSSPRIALAALVAGMAVYTLGEMAVSQAALVMLTSLPPHRERGSYLARNQLFVGVATALAPVLATSLLPLPSTALWCALTALSILAALLTRGLDTTPGANGADATGRRDR